MKSSLTFEEFDLVARRLLDEAHPIPGMTAEEELALFKRFRDMPAWERTEFLELLPFELYNQLKQLLNAPLPNKEGMSNKKAVTPIYKYQEAIRAANKQAAVRKMLIAEPLAEHPYSIREFELMLLAYGNTSGLLAHWNKPCFDYYRTCSPGQRKAIWQALPAEAQDTLNAREDECPAIELAVTIINHSKGDSTHESLEELMKFADKMRSYTSWDNFVYRIKRVFRMYPRNKKMERVR